MAIALSDQVYVVTPWPERYQHILSAGCEFIREVAVLAGGRAGGAGGAEGAGGEIPIPNPKFSHGPLLGFAQGLAEVDSDWALLLACDLARLQIEVLQAWTAQIERVADDAIALLPRHSKGWEPLCGFYRRSSLASLTQYIDQGGRSFQQWLALQKVEALPMPNTQMLFNCNTPADYATLAVNTKGIGAEIP